MDRNTGVLQSAIEGQSQSLVFLILLDCLATHGLGVERKAVFFNRQIAHFLENTLEPGNRVLALTEEIQISCRPMRLIAPQLKEHCALEDKHVAVLGLAQTIQQSLKGVASEDELEVLVPCSRNIHQPLPNRRRQVARLLLRHVSDSR